MNDKMSPFDAIFSDAGLDPMVSAQQSMRQNLPKRFWKEATIEERDGRFHLLLDGRSARTPGRQPLSTGHKAVADRLAKEWNAVEDRLDPLALPLTRLINVALDADADARRAMLDEIRKYADTDELCYRADRPSGLVDRQNTVWNPYLDRLKTHHGISLTLSAGIMHVAQEDASLDALRDLADRRAPDTERLCALVLATSLTGSAVLALALTEPGVPEGRAKTIWQAAHIDEDWNRAQWGEDAEATALRDIKWRDFEAAAFLLTLPD